MNGFMAFMRSMARRPGRKADFGRMEIAWDRQPTMRFPCLVNLPCEP